MYRFYMVSLYDITSESFNITRSKYYKMGLMGTFSGDEFLPSIRMVFISYINFQIRIELHNFDFDLITIFVFIRPFPWMRYITHCRRHSFNINNPFTNWTKFFKSDESDHFFFCLFRTDNINFGRLLYVLTLSLFLNVLWWARNNRTSSLH